MKNLEPIAPGVILWEEFMEPLGVTQNQVPRDLDITVGRISDIIHGKRAITADTALRFSVYFGTSAEFWLNLQADFDLSKIRRNDWSAIKPCLRAYSLHSLKKRDQRGLKPLKTVRKGLVDKKPTNKVSSS